MLFFIVIFNFLFANGCGFFGLEDLHVHAGVTFPGIFETDKAGAKYRWREQLPR